MAIQNIKNIQNEYQGYLWEIHQPTILETNQPSETATKRHEFPKLCWYGREPPEPISFSADEPNNQPGGVGGETCTVFQADCF